MARTALLAGDPPSIGRYRLLARLGSGGMGVVYLARDPSGATVALKVVRPEHVADPAFRTRFRREVEAGRRVRSAHVAQQLDAQVEGPQPYLVTEYVDGPDLAEVVARRGPLDGPGVVAFAVGLLQALAAIRGAGIVHRDLKPSNVLLGAEGPEVIDFGVAHTAGAAPVTSAGAVVGSAGWMAPEQATGEVTAPAVDVFAWASVVTFAATGRPPFGDGPPDAVMHRVVHDRPDLAGVPPALVPLLRRAFAKDPAVRPTPADLLDALLDQTPAPAPRRPSVLAASLAVLAALVLGTVAWAADRDERTVGPSAAATAPTTAEVTTSTVPPTTSPPTTAADPAARWAALQAGRPSGTAFSGISLDGPRPAAISVDRRDLVVWVFRDGDWTQDTSLRLDRVVARSSVPRRVDVTGDERLDFVVSLEDGGDGGGAGSVVSEHGGSWSLVPFVDGARPPSESQPGLEVAGRVLQSQVDGGTAVWNYDEGADAFVVDHVTTD